MELFFATETGGRAAYPPMFRRGGGVYGASGVRCAGTEPGLAWCPRLVTDDTHVCWTGEEAGVICYQQGAGEHPPF